MTAGPAVGSATDPAVGPAINPAPDPTAKALVVDWTSCEGRGLCADLLPELLTQDKWGYPRGHRPGVVRVPAELERPAAQAVRMCPKLALRLGN